MKAKEVLVCKSDFLKLQSNLGPDPLISPEIAHMKITEDIVFKALRSQSAGQNLGPDEINFQTL